MYFLFQLHPLVLLAHNTLTHLDFARSHRYPLGQQCFSSEQQVASGKGQQPYNPPLRGQQD